MRSRLLDTLDRVKYRKFLVYVTGPYRVTEDDKSSAAHDRKSEYGDGYQLLQRVRDSLRETGFNAFLSTDVEIPEDDVDFITQSVQFAQASNAVVILFPKDSLKPGAGAELGAILEHMSENSRERVLLLIEEGFESEALDLLSSAAGRWDVTSYIYSDEKEISLLIRLFIRNIMEQEMIGDLSLLPNE